MVSIKTTHVSSLSAQSLREMIEKSIKDDAPVSVEVASGDNRDVVFKEFLLKDGHNNYATGTTDEGETTVVVLLPKKEFETDRQPLVVLGH